MLEYRITDEFAGVRLDKYLRRMLPNVPTSHLFKMIRVKKVRINGKRAQPEQDLVAGDVITIRGAAEQLLAETERAPPPKPRLDLGQLKVLYEDEWLLAMDKPSGMAVHPGSGITTGTAVDLVREYLGPKAVRNEFAPSPAHRIDRETSGVLLVAKRRPVMVHFTKVFTEHRAKKRYLTLVKGALPEPKGLIDVKLAEHQQTAESRARRGVNLQEARTRYQVLRQNPLAAYLECLIETGRTHQIRRHFTAIGHPVAGDPKHGDFAFNREVKAKWGLRRLFLHAARLEFPHPQDGRKVVVEASLPLELDQVLERAGLKLEER